MLREVVEYQTAEGGSPFHDWLFAFLDTRVRARVLLRLDRLRLGNFGDSRGVGLGVRELRFHFGPGYRIYYALDGDRIVVLLCGGDKSSQTADIRSAQLFWSDYLRRIK